MLEIICVLILVVWMQCAGAFWDHVQCQQFRHYPGLLLILVFFRLILLDTSGCERRFSAMNRIKDKCAATMADGVLRDIMTIKALGPPVLEGGVAKWEPIDIILHNAIIHWRKRCGRSLGAFVDS